MVNRKAVSVYQTDQVLILLGDVQGRFESGAPEEQFQQDETVQSTSMFKTMTLALLAGASCLGAGIGEAQAIDAQAAGEPRVIYADQAAPPAPVRVAYAERSNMGGGFIEFLFGDGANQGERYQQQPDYYQRPLYPQPAYQQPAYQQQPSYQPQGALLPQQEEAGDPRQRPFDPKYEKQLVEYRGKERPGTIIVDTPNKFLFLVQGDGKALRYGIGVGKPGFTWSGIKTVSAKRPPARLCSPLDKVRSAPSASAWPNTRA